MCVIVNLDLVIPAILSEQLIHARMLGEHNKSRGVDFYLNLVTISANQIITYAERMKSWDLGRVIINFTEEDANHYLNSNTKIFEKKNGSDLFLVRLLPIVNGSNELSMKRLIEYLVSNINYSPRVLRAVGLLTSSDDDEGADNYNDEYSDNEYINQLVFAV